MEKVSNPGTQAHYEMYCEQGGDRWKYGNFFGVPEELVERLAKRSAEKACEELRELLGLKDNYLGPDPSVLFWGPVIFIVFFIFFVWSISHK
ncbi:MAG: hypothetical protein AAB706_04245 [Patescibacteria group bacterium]